MKTFDELFDGVIKHEGYYANVTGDRGGETYMGVARNLHPKWLGWYIVDAYKQKVGEIDHNEEIHNSELTQLVKDFYKKVFYDKYNIERINNGSLQEIIFDWCVNSGSWGSRGVQRVLNQSFSTDLKMDGIIGNNTISAINGCNAQSLFDAIKMARIRYYYSIAKRGENYKFLKGWLKRVGSIEFED
jgi:lysozyme family protein|nr:glycosyl hydrolase 108 family protein [uncultured Carboxylicivirga sp.]